MKKLICAMLALALILSVCVIPSFAEDVNLALDKTVEVEMETNNSGDNPDMGAGFWSSEFLTDGEWPAFLNNGEIPPLGWYSSSPDLEVDLTLELDLEDVYNISEIRLLPQKFIGGYTFPSSYEVSISADGKNYEVIGGETGAHKGEFLFSSYSGGNPYSDESYTTVNIPTFSAEGKQARYVMIHITEMGNDPGDGLHYSGLGELEVMGDPNPVVVETPVPEETEAPTEPAEEPTEAAEQPTEAPAENPTDAPDAPVATPAPEKKKGCGSFAAGTFAMVCLAGAALLIVRKKH
ncbi:MAG: discoidin domain-containing protein [Clostridia bacterium]|nr:discoidin domain-containing protein [Clostridia bacterium]MBR5006694.1 discoidin domain-containing protein [Clostridia bacterium]